MEETRLDQNKPVPFLPFCIDISLLSQLQNTTLKYKIAPFFLVVIT